MSVPPSGSVPAADNLRRGACPAGLPWTGETPHEDHGHTDCWERHAAADLLEAIDALCQRNVLTESDCQSIPEAIEECWGNSDDIAHEAWKIGYAAAVADVWRLLHPPVPAEETLPNTEGDDEPEHIPYGGTPYLETSGKLLRSRPSKHQFPTPEVHP